MDKSLIRLEKIVSTAREAEKIYSPNHCGGLSVKNFLPIQLRRNFVRDLNRIRRDGNLFNKTKRKQGQVSQEMETFYLEDVGESNIPESFRKRLESLRLACSDLYFALGKATKFERPGMESVGIHYYWDGSLGITPHQDYEGDINLVCVFPLSGQAPFYLAKTREKHDETKIDANPGSLILMRAARNSSEQDMRPFHYMGPVRGERYSIIMRWRTESGLTARSRIKRVESERKEEEDFDDESAFHSIH